ncbi:hypothetical protein CK501_04185 [Halovibrio salipaludis]|uniref:Uncharacterized protein n=1 Tax=Halovibrio salipaludis TaxID=2032626 RepID=A0A2A2FA28_9GAMM|nr:hypothetical protein [Halovibrio salipaludis]PAU82351.1 hypothetical protein CK501_04185 [Halovibrio salipaludis]
MTSTVLFRRLLIQAFIIAFLLGCSADQDKDADQPNKSAAALVKEAQQLMVEHGQGEELEKALKLTERATKVDPDYVSAYIARINILKRMGKVEGIVKATERPVELQPHPENRLSLCMAQEATGKSDGKNLECYRQLIEDIEVDSDTPDGRRETYLLALRLAGDEAFEDELNAYLKSLDSDDDDMARELAKFKFIEKSREDLLREIAPVSR